MGFKAWMLTTAVAAAALVAPVSAGAADLFINGSFEDEFTGWTRSDETGLITNPGLTNHFTEAGEPASDVTYTPRDGVVHAELTANLKYDPDVAATVTLLSQEFYVGSDNSRLTGFAAFLGEDYIDPVGLRFRGYAGAFNDFGFVYLIHPDGSSQQLFRSDIATAPHGFGAVGETPRGYGYTDWTAVKATGLTRGVYTLQIGVTNVGDGLNDSRMVADDFGVSVPEPTTWALMITGFFGMGAALRRQRRLQPIRIRVSTRRD
jgi:hypothetical protein